jgi:sugar O-acyltransferase (sialic acid O-acetyltransferase NeuD family)
MAINITLYGASGHCKVIIDILECSSTTIAIIVDDNPTTTSILGREVVHSSKVNLTNNDHVILSIGNNKVRKKLASQFNVNFHKAIHPSALISKHCSISEGTVIMAGAIINPDVTIGKHCIINTGAIIEHDCIIDDFVHISPNASLAGGVSVGEGSQVGIGATVIQGIKIGKWSVIGAGAVIIKDVPDNCVVVGNPGKVIKIKQNEFI